VTSVLELDISSGSTPGTYRVDIIQSPGGEATATFELDPTEIIDRIDDLQQTLLASSVSSRRLLSHGEVSVRNVGRRLFEALFSQQDVAGVYRASLAVAEERGESLRIVLRIGAPELAAMPWESMFDASAESYVSRREPLVRHVSVPSSPPPLLVQLPLRILAVIASPRGLAQLDIERERENLTRALGPLIERGDVVVRWLEHGTWTALQDALLASNWHVVHFIGHGNFDFERDESVLALETEAGRIHRVAAEDFVDLLRQAQPMPRLVVLNACETSTSGQNDLFAGAAATLVRGGVSAVTAMQFEISDQAAVAFCRGFYSAIGRGRGVDEAVRSGRVAIVGAAEGSLEWITPTLYLRGRETRLFILSEAAPRPAVEEPPSRLPTPPVPGPEPVRPHTGVRPWWRRLVTLGVAALVAVALTVFAIVLLVGNGAGSGDDGSSTDSSQTPESADVPESVDVVVDGAQTWTDTGVDVAAGDRVAVMADGQVFHNQTSSIGPEGFPNRPELITPYPELNHAALIGRVGYEGAVFYVGRTATVTAEVDGRLFLGINDGGLENNRGYWDASVSVEPSTVTPQSRVIKVNFQSPDAPTPDGYIADFGEPYGPRSGSTQGRDMTYGWVLEGTSQPVNLIGMGRDRNRPGIEQELDTLIHMEGWDPALEATVAAAWEMAVPNGQYAVTVSVGDSPRVSANTINVENVRAITDFRGTPTQDFQRNTVSVAVTDGRLTIDSIGGDNTKINYAEIVRIS
jgi:predicted nuclease of predicted toxin-antitoxin system